MKQAELCEAVENSPTLYVNFSFGAVGLHKHDFVEVIRIRWPDPEQETGLTIMHGNTLSWEKHTPQPAMED